MTGKRFELNRIVKKGTVSFWDNEKEVILNASHSLDLLNDLNNENEQLKEELVIYRKLISCSNCKYHNYNWYDDGDEFEVCDKGNDVTDGICKDWEEIE